MNRRSLAVLLKEEYVFYLTISFWVCEKSDGLRVLVFVTTSPVTGKQEVYLVNRRNEYYEVHGVVFASFQKGLFSESVAESCNDTILDGELVIGTSSSCETVYRLLLFDCLVIDGENLAQVPLKKRHSRLRNDILRPYRCYLTSHSSANPPFEVHVKEMKCAYDLDSVLGEQSKNLGHATDGLIFTSAMSGYNCGTDRKILKWKSPQEITIDLKLQLRFPPDLKADPGGATPDFYAKPLFQLFQHIRGNKYEPFDYLEMEDEEWEQWKASGAQLDDRIVECAWQPYSKKPGNNSTWRIIRIRRDKLNVNNKFSVRHMLNSIKDGVDQKELHDLIPAIRSSWFSSNREKARDQATLVSTLLNQTCMNKEGTCKRQNRFGTSLTPRKPASFVSGKPVK